MDNQKIEMSADNIFYKIRILEKELRERFRFNKILLETKFLSTIINEEVFDFRIEGKQDDLNYSESQSMLNFLKETLKISRDKILEYIPIVYRDFFMDKIEIEELAPLIDPQKVDLRMRELISIPKFKILPLIPPKDIKKPTMEEWIETKYMLETEISKQILDTQQKIIQAARFYLYQENHLKVGIFLRCFVYLWESYFAILRE